jgi:hypothetical protein
MIEQLLASTAFQFDGVGAYGTYMGYAFRLFFGGSALIFFLYLWKKGKLNMDEDPKLMMLSHQDYPELPEEDK